MAYNDIIWVENTNIRYTNFSGAESNYNPLGKRNFNLDIPDDRLQEFYDLRLNIKETKPDAEGNVRHYVKVDVNYNPPRGISKPQINLYLGDTYTELDEDTVQELDRIDIESVNCGFRLYKYNEHGDCSAKLVELQVFARESPFMKRHREYLQSHGIQE